MLHIGVCSPTRISSALERRWASRAVSAGPGSSREDLVPAFSWHGDVTGLLVSHAGISGSDLTNGNAAENADFFQRVFAPAISAAWLHRCRSRVLTICSCASGSQSETGHGRLRVAEASEGCAAAVQLGGWFRRPESSCRSPGITAFGRQGR